MDGVLAKVRPVLPDHHHAAVEIQACGQRLSDARVVRARIDEFDPAGRFAHPRSSSVVMLATVATVIYTHNLAIGVLVGVLLSGIFFAAKIAQLFRVTTDVSPDGRVRTYRVEGQLFYGSVEDLMRAFDFREVPERVVIDVSAAHIWDISSVQALDAAVLKFRRDGAEAEITGMNAASETLMDRLAEHDKPGALDRLMAH